jgi:cysteine desulfurase
MKQTYLDYASTTPMSPSVRAAMEPYASDSFYNPSALYLAAKQVKQDLEVARSRAAALLGVRPSELIFTAGTTEANNMVVRGLMALHEGAHCVVSAIEHDSVLHTAEAYPHSLLPVTEQGIIDTRSLPNLIRDDTILISVMLANNELGTVQPLAEVAKIVQEVRTERSAKGNMLPLYLHTDAAQAFNYMQVLPHSLGVDFAVISGSKIYGPKQTALLFMKTGARIQPLISGGGQEWGMRAGTENVAGAIGLVAAMEEAAALRSQEAKRLKDLQRHFIEALKKQIPQATINGSLKHRLPNNMHITIPGTDNETLIMQLDEAGIQAAAGSACSASSDEPSHVLTAIGLRDTDAQSSLRFTMGRATTEEDIRHTVSTLAGLL